MPAVSVVTGPMRTGSWRGQRLGACTDCRGFWAKFRASELDEIFEMMTVGRRVQGLIKDGADANELNDAARIEGMESLRESAIRRLAEGTTPYEEVVRITSDRT